MRNIYFIIFILILITTISKLEESSSIQGRELTYQLLQDGQEPQITTNDTKSTLIERYGADALTDKSIWIEEGTVQIKVTMLYKDTNPLTIFWGKDKTVSKIVIEDGNAAWSFNGIHAGTTLKELNELNGNPFVFNAFGWDEGGKVTDWQDGNLSNTDHKTEIELGFDWDLAEYNNINVDDFMGDNIQFTSDNKKLQQLNVYVARITIELD